MGKISISYTNSLVKSKERKYLRILPAHIKVEFQLNEDKMNLLLVHGSPHKINEYLFEDKEEKSMMRIMHDTEGTLCVSGIRISLITESSTQWKKVKTIFAMLSISVRLVNLKIEIKEDAM